LRYFCRDYEEVGTRIVDPLHEFELRHNRLLIAVADHVAGCNAGWSAAMSCSRGVPGVVFREANP